MCKAMEDMRNETEHYKALKVAKKMLEMGKYPIEEIVEISGLTPDQIQELTKS